MARGIMVAHELCVLCRNVVWVFAVKCERFQPLCAYYVEQTVCNRDCTHTDNLTRMWTPHQCKFRPVWQLRKQMQETSILRVGETGSGGGNTGVYLQEHPRQTVTHDGETGRALTRIWQVAALLIFLSLEPRGLEMRTPHRLHHLVPHSTSSTLGWTDDALGAQRNPKHLRFQWATEWHEYSLPASSDWDAIHI